MVPRYGEGHDPPGGVSRLLWHPPPLVDDALEDGGGRGGYAAGPEEGAGRPAGVDAGAASAVEEHLAVEMAPAHSPPEANLEEGAAASSEDGAEEAERAMEAWRAAVWAYLQKAGPVQNLFSVPSLNALPVSWEPQIPALGFLVVPGHFGDLHGDYLVWYTLSQGACPESLHPSPGSGD